MCKDDGAVWNHFWNLSIFYSWSEWSTSSFLKWSQHNWRNSATLDGSLEPGGFIMHFWPNCNLPHCIITELVTTPAVSGLPSSFFSALRKALSTVRNSLSQLWVQIQRLVSLLLSTEVTHNLFVVQLPTSFRFWIQECTSSWSADQRYSWGEVWFRPSRRRYGVRSPRRQWKNRSFLCCYLCNVVGWLTMKATIFWDRFNLLQREFHIRFVLEITSSLWTFITTGIGSLCQVQCFRLCGQCTYFFVFQKEMKTISGIHGTLDLFTSLHTLQRSISQISGCWKISTVG